MNTDIGDILRGKKRKLSTIVESIQVVADFFFIQFPLP